VASRGRGLLSVDAGRGPDELVGTLVAGRYRLDARIGSGALGIVYRARHVLIGRELAIKVLAFDRPGSDVYRPWFLREARAANRVNHPNVAEIYDYGETDDGLVYLVMELLVGERLSDRIAAGAMGTRQSLEIVEQVASALGRAHQLGVVHRDVKPDHVFLLRRGDQSDFVKLIDFGLAHVAWERRLGPPGAVLGTPEYIAPEQARGEEPGPAADLYSLGVVLFEMLTGRLPFLLEDAADLAEAHRSQPPPDPRLLRPGLDEGAAALTLRLLEKDPARRFRDAPHLAEACRGVLVRLQSDGSPVLRGGDPQPAPAPPSFAEGSLWAVAASLLGRMAAAANPSGGCPEAVSRSVEEIWARVAELARVDGELQLLETCSENLRLRGRETAERIGLQIEELARQGSRIAREEEELADVIRRLEEERAAAVRERDAAREAAEEGDVRGVLAESHRAREEAAAAAARSERSDEAIRRAREELRRREGALRQIEARSERLRDQLERETSRLEADREAGAPRLLHLATNREVLVRRLGVVARGLREHFSRRSECRDLVCRLDELELLSDGDGRPPRPMPARGSGPV